MGKKRPASSSRLNVMVRELNDLVDILLPDERKAKKEEELKDMDAFTRAKYKLTDVLHKLTKGVGDYEEAKQARDGKTDRRVLELYQENNKLLTQASKLWDTARTELQKAAEKKKIDPAVLQARQKYLEFTNKEMQTLAEKNSRATATKDNFSRAFERNKKARDAREARRQARRNNKLKTGNETTGSDGDDQGGGGGGGGLDDDGEVVMDEQTMAFMDQKQQRDKEIDEVLLKMSAGLKDLEALAIDIGTSLKTSGEMLEEVDEKMENVNEVYKNANKRLKNLIQENTGGATQWCPVVIMMVILLALIGYMLNII